MASTTAALVAGIIEVDTSITLTPFISVANEFVTECCASATPAYSVARLALIETWLAAHIYTVRDMRAEQEKAGDVSEKKQSKVDLGFDTSHYGQTAMRLDTLGGLAALNASAKKGENTTLSTGWLGSADESNIDYP